MADVRWKPNVTVAGIIEAGGRFLLVEESTRDGLMLNQPAGYLEDGETLIDAVRREVLEEAGHDFEPTHLVGIYQWRDEAGDRTFLRLAFAGRVGPPDAARKLDDGIVRTLWMTREEIAASTARHRSPWVLPCIDDYLAGRRVPLDIFRDQ